MNAQQQEKPRREGFIRSGRSSILEDMQRIAKSERRFRIDDGVVWPFISGDA
jgi:hypothetical protein